MKFTLSLATTSGIANNTHYQNIKEVSSDSDLQAAVNYDHVCGSFKNGQRALANFIQADCLVMDCDNDHTEDPSGWIKPSDLTNYFEDVAYAITFSRNHMKEKHGKAARPKFHVYFPIQPIKDAKPYAALKHEIQRYFSYFDANALDAARFVFGTPATQVEWHEGNLTVDQFVMSLRFFDQATNQQITEGQRNATLSHFAGRVIMRLGSTTEAYQAFLDEADKCDPPLPEQELNAIWRSALKFGKKMAAQPGYVPPERYGKIDGLKYLPAEFTDDHEAAVFAQAIKNQLCFTTATDFLAYNGQVWEEVGDLSIRHGASFAEAQLKEARALKASIWQQLEKLGVTKLIKGHRKDKVMQSLAGKSLELYKQYLDALAYEKFALKRFEFSPLRNMLRLSKARLLMNIDSFDKNPFLLNTPGGTYDLRKGMVGREDYQPADYLTKMTTVAPGNQGQAIWQQALNTFFCNDQELINYVQEIVGSVAIGQVFMEAMIIAYGDGRNGKSTFWNTIANVLGDYTGHLSSDALTTNLHRNIKPEMAELRGKRLAIAGELEEGRRLNNATVKQLCSTDEIYAEKKYMKPFSFVPSHTFVLYTNYLPHVGGNDEGIWRRLIVIPFNAKITGKSDIKNYTQYLTDNAGPAIMKWIIEGAQRIIASGFDPQMPKVVQEAVKQYHDDNDWLQHFLTTKCVIGKDYWQKSGQLYTIYREYCQSIGEYTRSTTDFYTALRNAGFTRKRKSAGSFILGLQLKADEFMND